MLVDSMGIHRASLYDTYGSKADLFKEAMDCYSEQTHSAFREALGPALRAGRTTLIEVPVDRDASVNLGFVIGSIEEALHQIRRE